MERQKEVETVDNSKLDTDWETPSMLEHSTPETVKKFGHVC